MKQIAILGFGIVGGGLPGILEQNRQAIEGLLGDMVEIRYILDLRDFPDSPLADRVVHTIDPILEDTSVEVVCETMGGAHPALEFSLAAMRAGKSVVTSNKELVAGYGDELLRCAAENGVYYRFEASVGGGIPVVRSFLTALAGEQITRIDGILNGTTNYILTRMQRDGGEYAAVLSDAQKLGYAEKDPTADVDGIDAQRKIRILTALACGALFPEEEVYAQTMRHISAADMQDAERLGCTIKLVASASLAGEKKSLYVAPRMVPYTHPLSHVDDVYNGISVTTSTLEDILYYGRGAGRYPTASAVMADVLSILSGAAAGEKQPVFYRSQKPGTVLSFTQIPFRYYIRLSDTDRSTETLLASMRAYAEEAEAVPGSTMPAFTVGKLHTGQLSQMLETLQCHAASVIRMME